MTNQYKAFDHLLFDRPARHVLRITINNPAKMNALVREASQQLHKIWAWSTRPRDARDDHHRSWPRILCGWVV